MSDIEDVEDERGIEAGRPGGVKRMPWLVMTWAVHRLPARTRRRYLEEFSAELVDLSPARQAMHALGLFRSAGSLARDLGPVSPSLMRLLPPTAAAAAVLAVVFAGVGLAARNAQPGGTLWGLTRVLYADYARSVEAAQAVRVDLNQAEQALVDGRVAETRSMLDQAHSTLPTVASEDGQADLRAKHAELVAKLPGQPQAVPGPPR
jgi:hypothetical protein